MAAWTAEEIASVRAAIVALASGQRAASISYAGPPARSVTYVPAQLGELRALLASMEQQANTAPHGFRRFGFSKGFGRG